MREIAMRFAWLLLAAEFGFAAAAPAAEPGGAAAAERTGGSAEPDIARVTLSGAAMLKLADTAELNGERGISDAIYLALANDPDRDVRAEALFRRARRLLALERTTEAAVLLRSVVDIRPDAAVARLELAHALNLLGREGQALRELRAAQSNGLPPSVAALVDRYSLALRARRPVGMNLEVAIAPSTNINRATSSDGLDTVFGEFTIDPEGKAKSGVGLAMKGLAYRRIPLGRSDSSLLLRSGATADFYRRSEFNDIGLDIAAGPEFALGKTQVALGGGATHRWFGGKPFLRAARAFATVTTPIGTRAQARLSGSAALLDHRVNDLQDGKAFSARIDVERAFSHTLGIGGHVGFDRVAAKDKGYATRGWRVGLLGWKQIARMTVALEAEFGRLRADDRLLLFPDRRSDRYSRFALSATLRQMEVAGFAPVARISVERNASSIAFYDYRRTRTELAISRAF